MEVGIASTDEELHDVAGVLTQLRPAFDREAIVARIKVQQEQGYRVAYVTAAGRVLCVAGFVISLKLAWGKHIYIDDLVTDETSRSSGAGKCLIDWFRSYARENGCEQIHLDSGVQRFAAHRFYLREGFDITSHHFAMTNIEA